MKRIGMPTSDDTILRHLKRRAKANRTGTSIRVVGLDDRAWRKGSTYGTIMVDLERREVLQNLRETIQAQLSRAAGPPLAPYCQRTSTTSVRR